MKVGFDNVCAYIATGCDSCNILKQTLVSRITET